MLKAFLFLVREHMHHLEFRANTGNLIQLPTEEDVSFRAGAVEQRQFEVLNPVANRSGHGEEGRDAGAACQTDDLLFIAQILIVEEALGGGSNDFVAYFLFAQQPIRHETAGIGTHRDRVFTR